jgi:hypothetical protein
MYMNLACIFIKTSHSPESQVFSLFRRGYVTLMVFLAGSLLFSGCDALGKLVSDTSEEPNNGEFVWKGEPVQNAEDLDSIKAKFGVTATGTGGVEAAFQELSAFIRNGGLENDAFVIKFGDWIDLEGGLSVTGYGAGGDEETGSFTHTPEAATTFVNPSNLA